MFGSGRETLAMSGSGGRSSRISGSVRETLTNAREWLGGPHECSGVVGMPSRMSGSGRESLSDVLQW